MITANEGGRHKAYAEMLGVVDYLRKPFPMELLLDAVQKALQTTAPAVARKSATIPTAAAAPPNRRTWTNRPSARSAAPARRRRTSNAPRASTLLHPAQSAD